MLDPKYEVTLPPLGLFWSQVLFMERAKHAKLPLKKHWNMSLSILNNPDFFGVASIFHIFHIFHPEVQR